jgi:hypothetical protein
MTGTSARLRRPDVTRIWTGKSARHTSIPPTPHPLFGSMAAPDDAVRHPFLPKSDRARESIARLDLPVSLGTGRYAK